MTVVKIMGDNSESCDDFPVGMRVLAVDDDPICLKLLDTLLRKCQYSVTTTSQARIALKMLRENRDRFDLVISDVHMPDMDGFKLLELVGLEMDLPVIMLSANSDPKLVMKGVTHGACDYLVKPVRLEELRNIWQHVLRRKKLDSETQNKSSDQIKAHQASGERHGSPVGGNADHQNEKSSNRKRKDEEYESEDNGNETEDPATQKKPRVVWSIELHRKFVAAVNSLGIEKAVPKRILDLMNVEGLTRENVASHLQKYRLYLRRISQQANMVAALGGVKDSPFMRIGSLDGLGDFRSLAGPGGRLANAAALSPYASGGSMLGRLNSPANINLRNLTPSQVIQPSHSQSPSNSVGNIHQVQNSNLFQGIPSSLELDQLQLNKAIVNFNTVFDDSRIFTSANTYMDPGPGVGSSGNLLNAGMYPNNSNNPMSGGGFVNQSSQNNMPSFNMESFNAGVTSGSAIESSKISHNPLLSTESFPGQLPVNSGRGNGSSGGAYMNSGIEICSTSSMVLPLEEGLAGNMQNNVNQERWGEQKQNHGHISIGSLNSQIPPNGIASNSNGILNQKMGLFANGRLGGNGSALLQQQNENDKLLSETRARSNENNMFFEQQKLQGGFVSQSYGSLDDMVNAMIKREQDESMPSCDFGFEDYSFGPGTI